jgi:hypothetical protein
MRRWTRLMVSLVGLVIVGAEGILAVGPVRASPPAQVEQLSAGPAGWSIEPASYTAQYYERDDTVLVEVAVEVWRPCTNCAVQYARGYVRGARNRMFITGVKVTEVALGVIGGSAVAVNSADVLDGGGTSVVSRTRSVRVQENYGPNRLRSRGDIAYRAATGRLVPQRLSGDGTDLVFRIVG